MGTYGLGCFLQEQQGGNRENKKAITLIRDLRNQGKLRALPIVATNKKTGSLIAADGAELCEYDRPGSGRWVRQNDLSASGMADGSILYLGSASHAGHIELKALCVFVDGSWYNIISGLPQR